MGAVGKIDREIQHPDGTLKYDAESHLTVDAVIPFGLREAAAILAFEQGISKPEFYERMNKIASTAIISAIIDDINKNGGITHVLEIGQEEIDELMVPTPGVPPITPWALEQVIMANEIMVYQLGRL